MPNRDFRDLADSQRETSRALQTLTRELRSSTTTSDFSRLLRPVADTSSRREELSSSRIAARNPNDADRRGDLAGGGSTDGSGGSSTGALSVTTRALQELGINLASNTKALERSTQDLTGGLLSLLSGFAGGGGGGGGLGGFLRGGFGLASLGLSIAGLFRRDRQEPEELTPFALPDSLSIEAANTRNILAGFPQIDRGQRGEIRNMRPEMNASPAQVVVNVSAMDSQSFMDRSNDIARAVREAMIHMHPLNDVIGEM
jgi:hypothetical protein